MIYQQLSFYFTLFIVIPAWLYSIYLSYGRIRRQRQMIIDQQHYITKKEVHYKSLAKYYMHLCATLSELQKEKLNEKWGSVLNAQRSNKTPTESYAALATAYQSIKDDHIGVTTDMKETIQKFLELDMGEARHIRHRKYIDKLLKKKTVT